MYPVEVKIAPKASWFTPQESRNYYGSYARQGVTVHWWGGGEGAAQHDNIVNYFLTQGAQGIKSVNYVVSDIKITKMVEPDNVAFASQSGNPVTVSIEFQPTLSAEGYKRGGWLISDLEKKYGKLQLYKHSFWFPTSCPGTINIDRLRQEANNAKGDIVNPTEAQVYEAFRRFAGREPDNPDQVKYYLAKDIRDLYSDLLNYEVIPKKAEVQKAFADLTELTPTQDQIGFYTNKPKSNLYGDLATYYEKNNPSLNKLNKTSVLKYVQDNLK